jgi:hypothetical protein
VSCWWIWWFGGGFGYRAIVQAFAFLSFPIAAFYSALIEKWEIKQKVFSNLRNYAVILIIAFCFANNLIRHYQYKISIIHWDAMSEEAFWYSGWKINMNQDERNQLEKMFIHPDYEKAIIGIR